MDPALDDDGDLISPVGPDRPATEQPRSAWDPSRSGDGVGLPPPPRELAALPDLPVVAPAPTAPRRSRRGFRAALGGVLVIGGGGWIALHLHTTRSDAAAVGGAVASRLALEARARRERAIEALAAAKPDRPLEERLLACDRALAIDPGFGEAALDRASLRWLQARSGSSGEEARQLQSALDDVAVASSSGVGPEAPLLQARILLDRWVSGDRAPLLEALERAIHEGGEGATGHLARGFQAEYDERWSEAKDHYTRAIEVAPKEIEGWLGRARAHLELGDNRSGRDDAEAARALDGSRAEALALLAEASWLVSERRDRTSAMVLLDRALELEPRHARALAVRATVRLERDELLRVTSSLVPREASERDARAALRSDRYQWRARLILAELAWARAGESRSPPREAWAVRKIESPEAWLLWGRIHTEDANLPRAREAFDRFLAATEPHAAGWRDGRALAFAMRGYGHMQEGRDATALEDIERAVELDPGSSVALAVRGQLRWKMFQAEGNRRDLEQALADLTRAIERSPGNVSALGARAQALAVAGRFGEALADLDLLIARLPAIGMWRPRVELMRGQVLAAMGDRTRAIEVLRRCADDPQAELPVQATARELVRQLESR